jgi:hypothetical protein
MIRRAVLLIFCSILTAGGPLSQPTAAQNQTVDTTVLAKHHYQNAVAAIAKSDWQTAKNELLQAVRLAPQNALVHYDLALAYSHTGQLKSAQTELNKALQIGLPAEQTKAAQELKQQFLSQAAESKNSGSGTRASASRQDQKGMQQPTLSEILDWLKDKLVTDVVDTSVPATYTGTLSYSIENIQGCRFTLVSSMHTIRVLGGLDTTHITKTEIDLSKSRSDVQVQHYRRSEGFKEPYEWEVLVYARDSPGFSVIQEDGVATTGKTFSDKIITFPDSNEDLATRAAKALTDAIEKCGGKRVKELY